MTREQLYSVTRSFDETEIQALIAFCKAESAGKSAYEAAQLTADFLDSCPGYEDLAEDFRNHWEEVKA